MPNSNDRGPEIAGVLIAFMILSTISVAARCYTRVVITRVFSIEDWLSLLALILYGAFTGTSLASVHYGMGKHTVDVPLEQRPAAIMYRWLAIFFYILVSGLTKVIVGLFLTRVCTRARWQNITLWVMMSIVSVYTLFYAFLNINTCQPISWEWTRYSVDPPDPTHCNSTLLGTIPTYISGFLNVIVDWLLAILPATILWNLQMERRLKVTTYGVLAFGSVASVASIVRLPYASSFLSGGDYMYKFTDLGIWSTVEIGSGLSASSLATLKPLFRKINLFLTSLRTGRASEQNDSFELPKGRFSMPISISGRSSKVIKPMRLEDVESNFMSDAERMVVSITAEDKLSRNMENNSSGILKEVSVTHQV